MEPHVHFELAEAAEHLQKLVDDLRSEKIGPDNTVALGHELQHVMHHMFRVWHARSMTIEQYSELSQGEFERLSNLVPNFSGTFVLGEFAFS